MGEVSRAKWERRIERAKEATGRAFKSQQAPRNAIIWLRGTGVTSVLIGGFGVMSAFFWPAVAAVYLGIALLLIDLYLEKFDRAGWLKYVIMVAMAAIACGFTAAVVTRKSPILASCALSKGGLDVFIENTSEDDYESMDFKIRPDFPRDYVSNPKQITSLPGVSFANPMPFISTEKGESVMITIPAAKPGESGDGEEPRANFLRVHCEHLPSFSGIRLHMDLIRPAGNSYIAVSEVKHVVIEGKFKGKFRLFKFKEEAAWPS